MIAAAPGTAAVIISPDKKSATISTAAADVFTVLTTGSMADAGTDLAGLNGSLQFKLVGGFNTSKLIFEYELLNLSTLNNLGSSIAVFGFNVAPDATLKVINGPFALGSGGNFSGMGKREFCVFDGSNCNGGANDGVFVNTPENAADPTKMVKAVGTFSLTYGNPAPTAITFSHFVTRWQRVGADQEDSASGGGIVTPPVPEPETWAMMLAGFAMVGGAMRARRRREIALA